MQQVIGVFGGSGFYELLEGAAAHSVTTPYGDPAAPVMVGRLNGADVAFLPRHGEHHQFPAHRVPFRANVWAMREVGVDRIIGPCAVGSLNRDMAPGHFSVSDQLVDRTWGRDGTFFDGPETAHLSFADPYCTELRPLAVEALRDVGATVHERGTVVVIQGPRFSTRAESASYTAAGWDTINMTQVPEVQLCRELNLCYVNIAVITDYDAGVAADAAPVTHAEVLRQFQASLATLKDSIVQLAPKAAAAPRACSCASSMLGADG